MFWLFRVSVLVDWWNDYHLILFWVLGVVAFLMLWHWFRSIPARGRIMPWTKLRMQRESDEQWERIRAKAAKDKGDQGGQGDV